MIKLYSPVPRRQTGMWRAIPDMWFIRITYYTYSYMEVSKSVLTSFCCTGTLGIAVFSTALAKTYQLIWQAILEYFPVFNEKQLLLSLFTSHCFPGGLADKESACQCQRPGFNPWVGKNPRRRERVAKSRTQLKDFHFLSINFKMWKAWVCLYHKN